MSKKNHKQTVAECRTGVESVDKDISIVKRHRAYSIVIVSLIVLILVTLIMVGMAFSWFSPKQDADLTVLTTDFETEVQYSLSGSEFAKLTDSINMDAEALDTLGLKVKFTGPSSAYIRVQLFESFEKLSGYDENNAPIYTMYPAPDVTYTLSPDWVKIGDYYYYKKVVTYTEVTEKDENGKNVKKRVSTDIPFVTNASSQYDNVENSDVIVNLVAVVEAVQPDRFEEFFGSDPDVLFANN